MPGNARLQKWRVWQRRSHAFPPTLTPALTTGKYFFQFFFILCVQKLCPDLVEHIEVYRFLALFHLAQFKPGLLDLSLNECVVWPDLEQSAVVLDCRLKVGQVHVRLCPPPQIQKCFLILCL